MSFYRRRDGDDASPRRSTMPILALLPLLLAPAEQMFPVSDDIIHVESSVYIAADAETVWQQIIAVPEIQPEERTLQRAGPPQFSAPAGSRTLS